MAWPKRINNPTANRQLAYNCLLNNFQTLSVRSNLNQYDEFIVSQTSTSNNSWWIFNFQQMNAEGKKHIAINSNDSQVEFAVANFNQSTFQWEQEAQNTYLLFF